MPSLPTFQYVESGVATVTVPQTLITATVVDDDGNEIANFTGANALRFPECLVALSAEDRALLMDLFGQDLVKAKAGVL